MQEDDRLVVGSNLGFLREAANTLLCDFGHGCMNVVNLDANVMESARLVLIQETLQRNIPFEVLLLQLNFNYSYLNWGILAKRVKQLKFGIAEIDKHGGDTMFRKVLFFTNISPHNISVKCSRSLQIRSCYSHMI